MKPSLFAFAILCWLLLHSQFVEGREHKRIPNGVLQPTVKFRDEPEGTSQSDEGSGSTSDASSSSASLDEIPPSIALLSPSTAGLGNITNSSDEVSYTSTDEAKDEATDSIISELVSEGSKDLTDTIGAPPPDIDFVTATGNSSAPQQSAVHESSVNLRIAPPPLQWKRVWALGPSKRHGHSMTAYGSQFIVFGGCFLDEVCYADLYVYDAPLHTWFQPVTNGASPSARGRHAAVLLNDELFIIGGSADETYKRDVFALNMTSYTWRHVPCGGELLPGREGHTAIAYGSNIFVFGGYTKFGYVNTLHMLDTVHNEWHLMRVSGDAPTPRSEHAAVLQGQVMLVFGGTSDLGDQNDLFLLDLTSFVWKRLTTTGPEPSVRHGPLASLLDDDLLVVTGGCSFSPQRCYNDTHVLDTAHNQWSVVDVQTESTRNATIAIPASQPTVGGDASNATAPAPSPTITLDNSSVSVSVSNSQEEDEVQEQPGEPVPPPAIVGDVAGGGDLAGCAPQLQPDEGRRPRQLLPQHRKTHSLFPVPLEDLGCEAQAQQIADFHFTPRSGMAGGFLGDNSRELYVFGGCFLEKTCSWALIYLPFPLTFHPQVTRWPVANLDQHTQVRNPNLPEPVDSREAVAAPSEGDSDIPEVNNTQESNGSSPSNSSSSSSSETGGVDAESTALSLLQQSEQPPQPTHSRPDTDMVFEDKRDSLPTDLSMSTPPPRPSTDAEASAAAMRFKQVLRHATRLPDEHISVDGSDSGVDQATLKFINQMMHQPSPEDADTETVKDDDMPSELVSGGTQKAEEHDSGSGSIIHTVTSLFQHAQAALASAAEPITSRIKLRTPSSSSSSSDGADVSRSLVSTSSQRRVNKVIDGSDVHGAEKAARNRAEIAINERRARRASANLSEHHRIRPPSSLEHVQRKYAQQASAVSASETSPTASSATTTTTTNDTASSQASLVSKSISPLRANASEAVSQLFIPMAIILVLVFMCGAYVFCTDKPHPVDGE